MDEWSENFNRTGVDLYMTVLFRLPLLHPPVWVEPPPKVNRTPLPVLRPIEDPAGPKPVKRSDCLEGGFNAARPCHWRSCRYHLPRTTTLDGVQSEWNHSCALDVADLGEHSLEEIGEILGLTRERIRQIEAIALSKLKNNGNLVELRKD